MTFGTAIPHDGQPAAVAAPTKLDRLIDLLEEAREIIGTAKLNLSGEAPPPVMMAYKHIYQALGVARQFKHDGKSL